MSCSLAEYSACAIADANGGVMVVLDDFQSGLHLFVRVSAQGSFSGFEIFLALLQIDDLPLNVPRSSITISIDGVWRIQAERKAPRLIGGRLRFRFVADDERLAVDPELRRCDDTATAGLLR